MLGQTLNKRIESFDIVKGLAMFSVVNWHVMNNIGIPGTPIGEHGSFIYQFLGLIQLPLFMFVSGFFAYKEKDGQRYRSVDLLSKAKHLLLPLVFAGLIWVMFLEYNTGRTFGGLLREYVLADNPFYFLLCLFELYVAYSLMMWLLRRFPGIVGSVAILIGGYVVCVLCYKLLPEPVMTALCLEQITLMFYVPFAFGVLCARFKNQWNLFIKDNKTVTWLLIVDIVFSIY